MERAARKLRPELNRLEGLPRIQTQVETTTVLYLAPFVFIALLWLVWASDWSAMPGQLWALLLLAALVVVRQQPFTINFKLEGGQSVPIVGSLSGLLLWAGMLVYGQNILWAPLLVATAGSLWDGWQRSRINQEAVWAPLALFMQEVGGNILASLIALTLYTALGGSFPLADTRPALWLPVFAAMLLHAFLPGIILLPIVMQLNQMTGMGNSVAGIVLFLISVAALTLFMVPFAVLASLLFVQGGLSLLFFFIVGVLLVNLLAYVLSRTNERSQQRTRELARLEALGEAIIQAPADASTLAELVQEHVSQMFPQDIVAVHLFPPGDGTDATVAIENFVWEPFRVQLPAQQEPLDEALWPRLLQTSDGYLVERNVVLPLTRAVYGHALLVKIIVASPQVTDPEPKKLSSTCAGGIYLLRQHAVGNAADSLTAVQSLASQIGSALYRAQVFAETLAHQKVIQELEFAGRIQASFLPHEVPSVPGWDIAATLVPARQTSGDFYDFVPLPDDQLGIVVADVADKGTGAALYMELSRTLSRTYAMQYVTALDQALKAANERILADTVTDQFVTVFYGVLDLKNATLHYANAGHNPALYLNRQSGEAQELGQTGIPLGMFSGMSWQQKTVPLRPGDMLIMYTDGVSEAQNTNGAEFGLERLLNSIKSQNGCSAQETQTTLLTALDKFVGDAPQFDDITLLVVMRQSNGV
jgi:serine phosphatase RsbU (regulator of sigma subunit)